MSNIPRREMLDARTYKRPNTEHGRSRQCARASASTLGTKGGARVLFKTRAPLFGHEPLRLQRADVGVSFIERLGQDEQVVSAEGTRIRQHVLAVIILGLV